MAVLLIKKYSNRRLYHTEQKCYITLDQLEQIIRQGQEVQVIDNQTQEDITRETLLQILASADRPQSLFSPMLLHQIIRLQEENIQEFTKYLESGLNYFVQVKQTMMQQISLWNQLWVGSMLPSLWQSPTPPPGTGNSAAKPADAVAQLSQLLQKVEEYEKKIAELQKRLEEKR